MLEEREVCLYAIIPSLLVVGGWMDEWMEGWVCMSQGIRCILTLTCLSCLQGFERKEKVESCRLCSYVRPTTLNIAFSAIW
jgi:hypothetical protein